MRHSFVQEPPPEEQEINITPMLDVVFIMLIFFIVTASFVKESGIDVSRPDTPQQQQPTKESKNIVVRIDANDRLWIQGRQIDPRAVRPNVERMHAENPEAKVVIIPSKQSSTSMLIQVMDQSRLADVYDIALAEAIE